MAEPLIHQHIRTALAHEQRYQARTNAYIRAYEDEGRRVVDIDPTGDTTWRVSDYRTGETIAKGDDGFAGYARVANEIGQLWVDSSEILEAAHEDGPPVTEGLPESLCEALADWVEMADPEEVEAALR